MLVEGAFGRVAAMFEWGTALKGPFRDLSKLFPALGARVLFSSAQAAVGPRVRAS